MQLNITSFRRGSLELIIRDLVSNSELIAALIVIRFLLKYIPAGLKDLASAYRELEEASFTRQRRKQLREQINADKELVSLDHVVKRRLVTFLDLLYQREGRMLPKVRRFALHYVKDCHHTNQKSCQT